MLQEMMNLKKLVLWIYVTVVLHFHKQTASLIGGIC
jgi:hypothetical protein